MKFFKTKLAALSITLLLSAQAKGMALDEANVLQMPMAEAPIAQPTLNQQAREAFSKGFNIVVDGSKSMYGTAMDNKTLVAAGTGLVAAGVVAKKYPKTAIAAGVVSSAAIATDLTGKYSPETIEKGKELAGNAVNSVATFAQGAGNYVVEAGKSAANFVAAHTPEFVKNVPSYVEGYEVPAMIGAGLVGYGAYKAYTPAKNAAKKAVAAARPHAKKIAVGTAVTGVAAAVAYQNQETIANFAKAAVDTVVKPTTEFVGKQAAKLKVNGARLVEAAMKVDVKGMAKDAGQFLNAHKYEIVGTGAIAAGTGYAIKRAVDKVNQKKSFAALNKAAASVNPKVMVPMTDLGDELRKASVLRRVDVKPISPRELSARAVSKPAPARLPVKEVVTNPAQVVLPGQVS